MNQQTENKFRFFEYDKKEAVLTTTQDGLIFFDFTLRPHMSTIEARSHYGDRRHAGGWLVLGSREEPIPTLQLLIDFATATHNNEEIMQKLRNGDWR